MFMQKYLECVFPYRTQWGHQDGFTYFLGARKISHKSGLFVQMNPISLVGYTAPFIPGMRPCHVCFIFVEPPVSWLNFHSIVLEVDMYKATQLNRFCHVLVILVWDDPIWCFNSSTGVKPLIISHVCRPYWGWWRLLLVGLMHIYECFSGNSMFLR